MGGPWTPGPWDVAVSGLVMRGGVRHASDGPYTPYRAGSATVSVSGAAAGTPSGYLPIVSVGYTDQPFDRGLANARLIASAPDLAEALEKLLCLAESLAYSDTNNPTIIAARAALSKARGETA